MELVIILVLIGAVVCVVAWMNVTKRDKRLRDQNLIVPIQYQSGAPVGVPGRVNLTDAPIVQTGAAIDAPSVDTPVPELKLQVDAMILQLDDAVRAGQQERDFAAAEFGDDSIATFTQALAAARATSLDAFERRRRLDDLEAQMPQLDRQQREMFTRAEIITLGNNVHAAINQLQAQVSELSRRRKM